MISRSELRKICGVTKRTLEHYASDEGHHILDPVKADSHGCYYSDDAIDRLQKILLLKECGFSLKEISSFLVSDIREQVRQMKERIPKIEKMQDDLVEQKKKIKEFIDKNENSDETYQKI